jgi:hypothetical protein
MTERETIYSECRNWEFYYLMLAYETSDEILQWMYLFDYAMFKYKADQYK